MSATKAPPRRRASGEHELDPDGIPQFGLVAEQVEKVNPNLVARDADGKVNTVRYESECNVAQRVPQRALQG
jgi:hypothetical protein